MMISRRTFMLAVAAAGVPASARAQARVRRIAWLTAFPRADVQGSYKAINAELEKLGWVDGRHVDMLEPRSSEGRSDRLAELAAQIVRDSPDVIIVQSAPATRALMAATSTIPLVMLGVGDPVSYGIVKSHGEPGGNVTGASYLVNESTRKTAELLKEIAPRLGSVVIFANPTNEAAEPGLRHLRAAAPELGMRVDAVEVRSADDFDAAFAAIVARKSEAILLWPEALVRSQRMRIGRFADEHRLPLAMVGGPALLDAGSLLTYGPAQSQYPALVARYVDRILRGARPATLPIEQPAKFELGVSLVRARALGLDVPASVLARADEVIR